MKKEGISIRKTTEAFQADYSTSHELPLLPSRIGFFISKAPKTGYLIATTITQAYSTNLIIFGVLWDYIPRKGFVLLGRGEYCRPVDLVVDNRSDLVKVVAAPVPG
ncbi:hypothetical protein M9H77_18124 [Catharanthus roseus]|uniref:Uncharacterized protein n=1 Tax=Catharanthus roseus TaxID=4058 RepID=A0ACC0B6K2_CATRO|nr:hypothetical protein M9H77_18124 [Catharanthus roseus]